MSAFRTATIAVLAVVALAGCSSSGGGDDKPSTSQLESKLKSEPQIKTIIQQGGTKADLASSLVGCIAKALEKEADPGDLNDYVDGKLDLTDLGAKEKGAGEKAEDIAKTCAQDAVSSISPSAGG